MTRLCGPGRRAECSVAFSANAGPPLAKYLHLAFLSATLEILSHEVGWPIGLLVKYSPSLAENSTRAGRSMAWGKTKVLTTFATQPPTSARAVRCVRGQDTCPVPYWLRLWRSTSCGPMAACGGRILRLASCQSPSSSSHRNSAVEYHLCKL